MLDILYIRHSGLTMPSVRFRVVPFVEDARKQGLCVKNVQLPKTALQRVGFYSTLPKAKVIVLQKKLLSSLELFLLRRKTKKLVFDFDDALWTTHPNQGNVSPRRTARLKKRLLRVCSKVDVVVAGNSYLAEQVRSVSKRIHVMPTPLDTERYVPASGVTAPQRPPVVGWMGTSGNLFFLPGIVSELQSDADVKFMVVSGSDNVEFSGAFDYHYERWSSEHEVAQLQAMDIGLMPLTDDEYTRGKCGFKLLQYMACGVAPIASDVGFNREIIRHGENGFLVSSDKEMAHYIRLLARDPFLRHRIAVQARRTVVERFSLKVATQQLWHELGVV